MTEEEKELLFRSLSELFDLEIIIADGLKFLDSYGRDKFYESSVKLWEKADDISNKMEEKDRIWNGMINENM